VETGLEKEMLNNGKWHRRIRRLAEECAGFDWEMEGVSTEPGSLPGNMVFVGSAKVMQLLQGDR